ncbi:hypothetical protein [Enterobacter bugandensis]
MKKRYIFACVIAALVVAVVACDDNSDTVVMQAPQPAAVGGFISNVSFGQPD